MVNKERLEELIKQGATVYEAKYGNINPVSLKQKIRWVHNNMITFEPSMTEKYQNHKYFNRLFETKEDAEFIAKNWCSRTERFEPPLWKDFDGDFWFNTAKGYRIGILRLVNDTAEPNFNRECIYIWDCLGKHKNMGLSNKKSYIKACEYAKALFLGKETANETNSNK